MSAATDIAVPHDTPIGHRRAWLLALPAAILAVAILCTLFREEGQAAIETWDRSTAYNHCWLVLPVALWLARNRWHRLHALRPEPTPALALLALPAGLLWLAADRLGIMEGRQLAALAIIEVAVLALFGWRVCRAMAAPLVFLVFLVPFGGFAVPLLQRITALLIDFGLDLFGIPHFTDGLVIDIPAGRFYVAEACAGLRFSIAALAFGTLYAFTLFRSPGRRLIVLALSLAVPILANGMRALGIVVLGHWLGSTEAAAADHLLYGWVFFSIVIVLLILCGLPFREDGGHPVSQPPAPSPTPMRLARLCATAILATGLAAAGPALSALLETGATAPARPPALLADAGDGCVPAGSNAAQCGGVHVAVQLLVFSPRATWNAVSATRQHLVRGSDEDVTSNVAAADGTTVWQVRRAPAGDRAVATASWLGGSPANDGLRTRARQAWTSVAGPGSAPVIVVLEANAPSGVEAAAMSRILGALGPALIQRAAELSGPTDRVVPRGGSWR